MKMTRTKKFQLDTDAESKKLNIYCFDGKIQESTGLIEVNLTKCFPTYQLIERIVNDLHSGKNALLFIDISNAYIARSRYRFFPEQYDPSEIEKPKDRRRFELEKQIFINRREEFAAAGLSEDNFLDYWKSYIIIEWFQYMLSNDRSHHFRELERKLSPMLTAFKADKKIDSLSECKKQGLKDNLILNQYTEYLSAVAIVKHNHKYLRHKEKHNQALKELKIAGLELFVKLIREFGTDRGNYQVFTCPICRKCKEISAGSKELAHCGSKQCKREYSRIWAQDNYPHPKQGWVFDPSLAKPWECLGECGSNRRQLNSDRICSKCYRKLNTSKGF
jgi:hypothetical protein